MVIIPNSTQEMLDWILSEKGYSLVKLAAELKVSDQTLRRVLAGRQPSGQVELKILRHYLRYHIVLDAD